MMNNFFTSLPLKETSPEYICTYGSVHRYDNVGFSDFEAAANRLIECGCKMHSQNTLEGVCSKTLYSDNMLYHLVYSQNEAALRISTDTRVNLIPCEPSQYSVKNDTVLYQFETDHSLIDCGMCYIIRCCDGSFFLIDSAHIYSVNDNERIHSFLRALTPSSEPIRICGWFFTHGHSDHICKFTDYVKYNCSDTVIEAVYYNFVPSNHRDSTSWLYSEKKLLDGFECLMQQSSSIKCYAPRTLQKIFARNLVITVLCTHEDVWPNSFCDFNDSSTVVMIEANGSKIFIPGDACREESKILLNRYNSSLKCDIAQLSHHGHTGLTSEVYNRLKAECLLIPNTRIKFDEEWERREENRLAVSLCKESYISADGTVGVPLPYSVGNVIRFADETTENFEGIYNLWGYEYTDEFKCEVKNRFIKQSGV